MFATRLYRYPPFAVLLSLQPSLPSSKGSWIDETSTTVFLLKSLYVIISYVSICLFMINYPWRMWWWPVWSSLSSSSLSYVWTQWFHSSIHEFPTWARFFDGKVNWGVQTVGGLLYGSRPRGHQLQRLTWVIAKVSAITNLGAFQIMHSFQTQSSNLGNQSKTVMEITNLKWGLRSIIS